MINTACMRSVPSKSKLLFKITTRFSVNVMGHVLAQNRCRIKMRPKFKVASLQLIRNYFLIQHRCQLMHL